MVNDEQFKVQLFKKMYRWDRKRRTLSLDYNSCIIMIYKGDPYIVCTMYSLYIHRKPKNRVRMFSTITLAFLERFFMLFIPVETGMNNPLYNLLT